MQNNTNTNRTNESTNVRGQLGRFGRDRITGFVGTIVARTEWLYEGTRFVIQGRTTNDGKTGESLSVHENALELITEEQYRSITGDRFTTTTTQTAATQNGNQARA